MDNVIDYKDTYMVNPKYTIKSDVRRAVLTNARGISNAELKNENITTGFAWPMHPMLAVLFSYFDGTNNLLDTIKAVAEDFKMDERDIEDLIVKIINLKKRDTVLFKRLSITFAVPMNFIVKKEAGMPDQTFDVESFFIEKEKWDLSSKRLYIPHSLALMLNNRCYTDCVYCYANKDHKPEKFLSLQRIKEIIREADAIGVSELTLNGGDFFIYKYWREVLTEVLKYHYAPYISTKYPISAEDIEFLKKVNMTQIQISFDSDSPEQLQQILKVKPGYHQQMLTTFRLLEEAGIDVDVKAVITKYNCEVEDVRNLINRIKQYKNIKYLSIAPGEASLYKKFSDYKVDLDKLKKIEEFVNSFRGRVTDSLRINCQGYLTSKSFERGQTERIKVFKERSSCSGNFTALYILPDGQVGICEQLYWESNFIVGDLNEQSIMEVWNSDKAKKLFEFPQQEFPEESICRKCDSFHYCRYVKGVCWRNIFFAYGMGKMYAPDPDCPYAPKPTQVYFHQEV